MKFFKIAVFVLALAMLAVPALAGGSGSGQGGAQQQGAGGAAAANQIQGRINAVDQRGGTISVATPSGASQTLIISRQTKIMTPQGTMGSMASLKKGEQVQATYHKSGNQHVADQITVLPPGSAPSAPPPTRSQRERDSGPTLSVQ